MMNQLKNSVISKVLQVLLIGYFLISSLSLSQNLSRIATKDADVHKKENIVWNIFKKVIKCGCNAEELEDSDNEPGANNNKIKLTSDYLLPSQAALMLSCAHIDFVKKIYINQSDLSGILYNKIHLPPPERTV